MLSSQLFGARLSSPLNIPWSLCFLWEVPHRQILHPMPFYWIFRFIDYPEIRNIGIAEKQDFRVFRNCRNPISENPDFQKSENPEFRISGLFKVLKFGCSEIRKSRFSDFRGTGCRSVRGIRCQASEVSRPIKEAWWLCHCELMTWRFFLTARAKAPEKCGSCVSAALENMWQSPQKLMLNVNSKQVDFDRFNRC